jgi:soluble lytic murein transglycosylase-like protein
MHKFAKAEKAMWAVGMLFSVTLIAAQAHMAAKRPDRPEWAPVVLSKPLAASVALAVVPASSPPAIKSEPVASVLDKRLVAGLLVESIVQIESAGNPRTVGRHGERGLMQIKAGTWSDVTRRLFGAKVSFERAFEPTLNRQVGEVYLAHLQKFLAKHRRSWKADERSLLLACYNAGPERVLRAGFDLRRVPARTRDYVLRGSALHDSLLADHNLAVPGLRVAVAAVPRPPSS